MTRPLTIVLTIALVAGFFGSGNQVLLGADQTSACWDEYSLDGTKLHGTVVTGDSPVEDCTPASECLYTYRARDGKKVRWLVPHGADPAGACSSEPDPTAPATSDATTSTSLPPSNDGDTDDGLGIAAPGTALPDEATCAGSVVPMSENRPENAQANATPGTLPNARYPRATGAFTGTTDEIIQWVACKWGIDSDLVRAQIVVESYWKQTTLGDFTSDPEHCNPALPIGDYPPQFTGDGEHSGECPESVGLGQVRWLYHLEAFEEQNALKSSAYNLDYTYAVWRSCFEGEMNWLNDVDGRGDYAAGDALGCMGVWYTGRWYNDRAHGYIQNVEQALTQRVWQSPDFPPAEPATAGHTGDTTALTSTTTSTTSTSTVPTTTAAPSTTTVATSTTSTSPPSTLAPTVTTIAESEATSGSDAFVADFTGNQGLDAFRTGVWHRDDHLIASTSWLGDHDESCGPASTGRRIERSSWEGSFYSCRDHLMTSVGDTSGYSIAWFSPRQTFTTQNQISWDVNVTDLGHRQWWDVAVIPAADHSYFLATTSVDGTDCLVCATASWLPTQLKAYGEDTIAVGIGPLGGTVNIMVDGLNQYDGWRSVCGDWAIDPDGCGSKAIRRPFSLTDNDDGTITVDFGGMFTRTIQGSFPDEYIVVFKDHNYTPDKDGEPIGHTWHWDNIIVS